VDTYGNFTLHVNMLSPPPIADLPTPPPPSSFSTEKHTKANTEITEHFEKSFQSGVEGQNIRVITKAKAKVEGSTETEMYQD